MRLLFSFALLCCIGFLGYAQYLQHIEGLMPCPLCVAQRVAYWLLGLTALLAFLHNPRTNGCLFYGSLMSIFSLVGAVIAARHAWLMRYPESFECGVSAEEAFLNALPIAGWWPGMFEANGDCASIDWKFLSLTIPDWSLIAFLGLGSLGAYILLRNR